MSVSYTGDATMDEPALRDVERWKDKIEVRLDNRQVFFLFFGSALCACMLFVLGVIVGKRLESRGRATAPEVQDPLAVLDRINASGAAGSASAVTLRTEQALTFPKALSAAAGRGRGTPASVLTLTPSPTSTSTSTSTSSSTPPMSSAPKAPASSARAQALAARTQAQSSSSAPSVRSSSPAVKTTVAVRAPAAIKAPAAVKAPVVAARVLPSTAPSSAASAGVSVAAASPSLKPAAPATTIASPSVGVGVNPGAKARFTLQLSSFPDRNEADAFAKKFSSQGAYVVVSEIPGKGTWYRVRVGSYASSQEAIAAKGTFERQNNVIAYIAGR